jgi:hypothetical protein
LCSNMWSNRETWSSFFKMANASAHGLESFFTGFQSSKAKGWRPAALIA